MGRKSSRATLLALSANAATRAGKPGKAKDLGRERLEHSRPARAPAPGGLTRAQRAVGAFLKSMREMQGLSQAQLAALTEAGPWKVSRGAISAIERGDNLPSFEGLMALCKVLHVDPLEVLERADLAVEAPVALKSRSLEDLRLEAQEAALAGEYRRAVALYQAMLERLVADAPSDAGDLQRLRAEIELQRSRALQRCGALLSAETGAKRAIAAAEGDPGIQSFAYAVLAKIEIQRGFPSLARAYAERAVEIARGGGDGVLGRALLALGEVCFVGRQFEQARQVFLEAREHLRRGGDTDHASHVEGNVGLCWLALGDLAKARVWLWRALELARKDGFSVLEARWLTELGRVALEAGELDEADRLALRALIIARSKDHAISVFRAEWLRHRVVKRRDPTVSDHQRLARLRKIAARLADHAGEPEIQEYRRLVAGKERTQDGAAR